MLREQKTIKTDYPCEVMVEPGALREGGVLPHRNTLRKTV